MYLDPVLYCIDGCFALAMLISRLLSAHIFPAWAIHDTTAVKLTVV